MTECTEGPTVAWLDATTIEVVITGHLSRHRAAEAIRKVWSMAEDRPFDRFVVLCDEVTAFESDVRVAIWEFLCDFRAHGGLHVVGVLPTSLSVVGAALALAARVPLTLVPDRQAARALVRHHAARRPFEPARPGASSS